MDDNVANDLTLREGFRKNIYNITEMNGLTVYSVKKEIIACRHATTDLMTINESTTARSCLVTMPGSSFFGFKVRAD